MWAMFLYLFCVYIRRSTINVHKKPSEKAQFLLSAEKNTLKGAKMAINLSHAAV